MTRRPPDQHLWGRRLRRWPEAEANASVLGFTLQPFEVWRSRDFLVTLYAEGEHIRVTVCRTHQPDGKMWADGITWDELQEIKAAIGRNEEWAVEIYPAESELVNQANMRHLWLLDEPPPFAWIGQAT